MISPTVLVCLIVFSAAVHHIKSYCTIPVCYHAILHCSHMIFTLHIETRASAEARERALLSKLHLVDLAGSERAKKSGAEGDALREAGAINRSLAFLEQVVAALGRRDAHVPYR